MRGIEPTPACAIGANPSFVQEPSIGTERSGALRFNGGRRFLTFFRIPHSTAYPRGFHVATSGRLPSPGVDGALKM